MKTPRFLKATLGVAMLVPALTACSTDKSPHYKERKTYGVNPTPVPAGPGPSDGPLPEGAPAPTPAPGPTEGPAPSSAPAPDDAPAPGAPDPEDPELVPITPADPSTAVLHRRYRGNLNADSLLALTESDAGGPRPFPVLLDLIVKGVMRDRETDELDILQTLGDGVRFSSLAQTMRITDHASDGMLEGGGDAGVTIFDREAQGDGCPSAFICARRARVQPEVGEASTVCFFDPSGKSVLMPVAIATNFTAADYAPHVGSYGPYRVLRFADATVDCTSAADRPRLAAETVRLEISLHQAPLSDWGALRYHTKNALPVQYEVDLAFKKAAGGDDWKPYLDQTTGLAGRTRFLMNEDRRVLVKVVKTLRKGLNGTGFLGFDGVLVDWEGEICRDELAPAATATYCEP